MVDTVVIKQEPAGEPDGHQEAMIAKVDQATTPVAAEAPADTSSERPEWLPEKFKSPEDLAKAYAELESKLGQKAPEPPKAETPAPTEATADQAKEALSEKGLDLSKYSAKFAQAGALDDADYAELQAAGFDRSLVDQFIEGQKARAVQFDSAIKAEVGGDDRYIEMVTWAKANLTPAEIDAYNASVSSGNPEQAKLAAVGLAAKFEKSVGAEPKRTLGGTAAATASDSFESLAQVTAAMKDPAYKTDPAYRSKVQAKLARSSVF